MAFYNLLFDSTVEKDLAKISRSDVRNILLKTNKLTDNPRPSQSLKLENSDMTYRLRVGNYRVVYQIDDTAKTVTIYHIRHRKDIYRFI
ncbi:MAG: type II toxin-antitoxin system RelE/ParE family toxin [Deltaproteobacteria bacterium]|nr:type II toxin-antitoxin system RelE/ParE family toxin [Deltaproteobacteria bacterium]MBI2974473.1 type II toxin-antitoxin system RelE/ParE family toxin [Deltaproteobacteria bacterium]